MNIWEELNGYNFNGQVPQKNYDKVNKAVILFSSSFICYVCVLLGISLIFKHVWLNTCFVCNFIRIL